MLIRIKGSHISVSNVYVRLCYSHFYYVPLSLRIQHATCRERDSTTGYENGLLGNKQGQSKKTSVDANIEYK